VNGDIFEFFSPRGRGHAPNTIGALSSLRHQPSRATSSSISPSSPPSSFSHPLSTYSFSCPSIGRKHLSNQEPFSPTSLQPILSRHTKPYLTHLYFFFNLRLSGWLPTPPTSHSQIASLSLRGGKPVISSLDSFSSHAVHPSLRRTLGFSRLTFFPSARLVASSVLLLCFRLSDSAFVLPKLHPTPLLEIIENKSTPISGG
jgi:hypothetical protein